MMMKKRTKRHASMFMIVVMLMSLLPFFPIQQVNAEPEVIEEVEESGTEPRSDEAVEVDENESDLSEAVEEEENESESIQDDNHSNSDDAVEEHAQSGSSVTKEANAQSIDTDNVGPVSSDNRTVRLTYEREDGDYDDWDVWVWNTGVQDDNIDFIDFHDTGASAYIEVADTTQEIGFIIRKGDWEDREPNGQELDRVIHVNEQDRLTKAHVIQGEEDFHIVPGIPKPEIEGGSATFFYRDKELYEQDQMDDIDSVELEVASETFEMEYEEENERYRYEYEDFPEGSYEYVFHVTIDGETEVVTDPYYDESTIDNRIVDIKINGEVEPPAIDYNENAVLTINVASEIEAGIRRIYADLSELGGPEQLDIDPELNEVTISVAHDVTAGEKEIPLTVIDEYGNEHGGLANVEVNTRQFVGEGDFDWDEALIYFMLTDRFFDGDSSNNDPYGIGYDDYDEYDRGTYQGGDFKGITEKLDYLDELGINTIWISPIVENIRHDVRYNADDEHPSDLPYFGYHGYWALNFEELNPHFGTMEDFHEMIDEAAARDMKIMVDVVLNHTGYGLKEIDGDIPESERPAGYPTDEERAFFSDMLRQGEDVGSDEVTGELAGLPDFITENPEVREQIIEWQTNWIEKSRTEQGNTIDYFRVDTVKHVEDTTWMAFKNALTREMPEFKMIGESWGAGQNDDHGYLRTGMMDSLLDFEFKYAARDFVNGSLESVNSRLETRNHQLDNTATLGQFLGSHDEQGFLEMVDGDEGKLKTAASLQMTAKGQPVIYYGEELGLSGADNYPYYDNRYDMAWDEVEENEILEHYQKLLSFRNDNSHVLARGDRSYVAGSDDENYLLFDRRYDDETVYVGLNVAEEAQEITLSVDSEDVTVTDYYSGTTYEATEALEITLTIPGGSDGGTVLLSADDGEIIGADRGSEEEEIPENTLRVHYERADNDFNGYGLWVWEDVVTPSEEAGSWPDGATPFTSEQMTDYGAYVDIELIEDASQVGMLVNHTNGENLTGDIFVDLLSSEMNEIWLTENGDVFLYEPVELPENTIRIHYQKDDGHYEPWGIWTWGDVTEPSNDWPMGATPFSNDQTGKYGAYIDVELTEEAEGINFLFVERDQDGNQTGDMSFSDLENYDQIFVREGDETVYTNPYYIFEEGLRFGELLNEEKIELTFTSTVGFTEDELKDGLSVFNKNGSNVSVDQVIKHEDGRKVTIHGLFNLDDAPYEVVYMGRTVQIHKGWRLIDEEYGYEGDLGATVHEGGSATLKLWSPSADNVSIILYHRDDQYEVVADDIDMTLGERGVWEVTLDEGNTGISDLTGFYYHYEIERGGETVLALDPYATSMATWDSGNVDEVPIGKAAIVDPSAIGPKLDFAEIEGFEKREDAIIYEVHVRDFTSDPSIDDELEAQFGTFASFVEKLDYIEDLGVTHIQLLPVMSYFFADEYNRDQRLLDYSSTQNNYNWGYDPHSYFSLTGMYSENPDDAEKRIEEFKRLIDEIHSRNMGVILDVVYNHTARVEIFENLEPNYYHFMDADGTPRTSFGGGRLGTTHKMARRILVDSIMYWTEEFKVDGFRFDMMGDHDAESIQLAYDKVKEVNPNVVMIGEGWRTFVGDENGGDIMPADQDWMQYTESVGSFSDDFRNELKSGFGSEGEPRFITGGARDIQRIYDNVTANPHNFTATNPGDVVPYIAAHDNLTLHDVIAQSIQKDPDYHQEEIHKRIRLGNAMVLTAQGTAFLHAGQEFGRTKQFRAETEEAPYKSTYMTDEDGNPFEYPYFIHDSYDSTDAINMIDWEKATNEDAYPINNVTREYTTGLIELRRSTNAFRLGTMDEIDTNVSMIEAPEIGDTDLLIGYKAESTDDTGTYFVFVNADDQQRTLTVDDDLTNGEVIVDANEAGVTEVADPTGVEITTDSISLDPLTTVVVRTDTDEEIEDDDRQEESEVITKPTVEEGYATIDDRILDLLAVNGKLVIDLSDYVGKKSVTVTLTEAQIQVLRAKKASLVMDRGDASMVVPLSNLSDNGDAAFTMVRRDDIARSNEALSVIYAFTIEQNGEKVSEFTDVVTLSFTVDTSNVGHDEDVKLHYYDEESAEWDVVESSFADSIVTANVSHFSTYAVFELADEEDGGTEEELNGKDDSSTGSEPGGEGSTGDGDGGDSESGQGQSGESRSKDDGGAKREGEGEKLPETATNLYNLLLIGSLLLIAGVLTFWYNRQRKQIDKG
ncbi:pullulanase [Evansella halocellulosilytica]|uniref:pullulanase n=1 Tax=Evansella halocellulosilytica TaxID=2011013 RepID=UPI000BB89672|nr:pullulanase [Evansella halocellulosilytica]